ncbi:MAG: MarR family transcriptional regulator [Firmicutes bacterium]|nr:MarR family transcriptional regulator [Bacillota bacterium]
MKDFTKFTCFAMRVTMKKLEKHLAERFEGLGINILQSFILISLMEKDGSTLTEVSNRAMIENSSLTTLVDRLERDGLVVRRMDGQDRRAIRLYLTESGNALAEKALQALAEFNWHLKNRLGGLEDPFLKGLSAVSESLD